MKFPTKRFPNAEPFTATSGAFPEQVRRCQASVFQHSTGTFVQCERRVDRNGWCWQHGQADRFKEEKDV